MIQYTRDVFVHYPRRVRSSGASSVFGGTNSSRRGGGGDGRLRMAVRPRRVLVVAAAEGRRQVRGEPAWTRLISSARARQGLWASDPPGAGCPAAATCCCLTGTPCPSVSAIRTRSSAENPKKKQLNTTSCARDASGI